MEARLFAGCSIVFTVRDEGSVHGGMCVPPLYVVDFLQVRRIQMAACASILVRGGFRSCCVSSRALRKYMARMEASPLCALVFSGVRWWLCDCPGRWVVRAQKFRMLVGRGTWSRALGFVDVECSLVGVVVAEQWCGSVVWGSCMEQLRRSVVWSGCWWWLPGECAVVEKISRAGSLVA